MRPQAIFEVLRGQRLTSVLAHDPWGIDLPPDHAQIRWPLFGALALAFEQHTLLLGSPLRYLNSQEGMRYGLADGGSVTLGFRALLCESEQAEAVMQLRPWLPRPEVWWGWLPRSMPVIGRPLQAEPWLSLSVPGRTSSVMLDFGEGLRYRLEYRLDLDGAIEFSSEGTRSEPDGIEVLSPKGPMSWLHPRNIAGMVLDNQRWRNAEQWPIEIRRQYRNAALDSPPLLELLNRAWKAYFLQNPSQLRRLLSLSIPVRVTGLPEGFVQELRDELLAEQAAASLTDPIPAASADAAALPSVPTPARSAPGPAARC